MLRRPPTVITLTADDLAMYEVAQARKRLQLHEQQQQLSQAQRQGIRQQREDQLQQRRNASQTAANAARPSNAGLVASSSSRQDVQQARRSSQPQPSQPTSSHAYATPPDAPVRAPSGPAVMTRQRPTRHDAQAQGPPMTAAAVRRRQLQRPRRPAAPSGSGSPHERVDGMGQLDNDVNGGGDGMDVSDASPSVESDGDDEDETGELDDSMAGAGARYGAAGNSQYHLAVPQARLAQMRQQAQMRRMREGQGRLASHSGDNDTENEGSRRPTGNNSFETPTNAPQEDWGRGEGEHRQRAAAAAAGARREQQQQQQQQQQQRTDATAAQRQQPALTRHERIMGRVEAPAPQGMGERSMR